LPNWTRAASSWCGRLCKGGYRLGTLKVCHATGEGLVLGVGFVTGCYGESVGGGIPPASMEPRGDVQAMLTTCRRWIPACLHGQAVAGGYRGVV
jgi:hypothetical protein